MRTNIVVAICLSLMICAGCKDQSSASGPLSVRGELALYSMNVIAGCSGKSLVATLGKRSRLVATDADGHELGLSPLDSVHVHDGSCAAPFELTVTGDGPFRFLIDYGTPGAQQPGPEFTRSELDTSGASLSLDMSQFET